MAKTGFTKNLTNEKIQEIINLYQNGISANKIAEKFETSRPTINSVLKKNGIELNQNGIAQRKYKIDEHYFDAIDTPNKAYILGFIYADGCNFTPSNLIRITLKDTDKDFLELLRLEMKNEKPLKFIDKNQRSKNGCVTLELQSKHMSEKLEELGCPNNKSLILQFPNFISEELMSHFIRGYFDGDGYIQDPEKRSNCTMIIIVSSKFFIDSLKNYLQENLGIESHIRIMKNSATESLYITKTQYVKDFCEWIYKNADLYMKRKYNRYIKKFYPELLKNNN